MAQRVGLRSGSQEAFIAHTCTIFGNFAIKLLLAASLPPLLPAFSLEHYHCFPQRSLAFSLEHRHRLLELLAASLAIAPPSLLQLGTFPASQEDQCLLFGT